MEAIESHRPDRNMSVLKSEMRAGELNMDTSTPVRTWDEAVKSRIPIWRQRLCLSKLYVEKKQNGSFGKSSGISHEHAMITIKPSKQIYNEVITKGPQHSLYIVVYTKQKDGT